MSLRFKTENIQTAAYFAAGALVQHYDTNEHRWWAPVAASALYLLLFCWEGKPPAPPVQEAKP